jgi:manganese-dependent inorganic pyrophosphatase
MLGSILSDTGNLKTQTTTYADREAVKALSEIAGVTDIDAFYDGMYKALVSHEGMTDEEIFFSDYKEYKAGNFNYSIGCINVYEEQEANELAVKMKALMPETLKSTGMDMTFTQIGILREDKNITYLIPSDETAAEVLEQAYGDVATFDGTSYILSPGISRKKNLVPAINNILESYPKE